MKMVKEFLLVIRYGECAVVIITGLLHKHCSHKHNCPFQYIHFYILSLIIFHYSYLTEWTFLFLHYFTDWSKVIMLSFVWQILPGISTCGWTAGCLVLIWGRSLMGGKPVTQPHRRQVTVNFDFNVLLSVPVSQKTFKKFSKCKSFR